MRKLRPVEIKWLARVIHFGGAQARDGIWSGFINFQDLILTHNYTYKVYDPERKNHIYYIFILSLLRVLYIYARCEGKS